MQYLEVPLEARVGKMVGLEQVPQLTIFILSYQHHGVDELVDGWQLRLLKTQIQHKSASLWVNGKDVFHIGRDFFSAVQQYLTERSFCCCQAKGTENVWGLPWREAGRTSGTTEGERSIVSWDFSENTVNKLQRSPGIFRFKTRPRSSAWWAGKRRPLEGCCGGRRHIVRWPPFGAHPRHE